MDLSNKCAEFLLSFLQNGNYWRKIKLNNKSSKSKWLKALEIDKNQRLFVHFKHLIGELLLLNEMINEGEFFDIVVSGSNEVEGKHEKGKLPTEHVR